MSKFVARITIMSMWVFFVVLGLFQAVSSDTISMPIILQKIAGIALVFSSYEGMSRVYKAWTREQHPYTLTSDEHDRMTRARIASEATTDKVRHIIHTIDIHDDQTKI